MLPRRSRPARPAPNIPPYGVLVGRMIFIGGLVLALLGLGFLVMLGIAGGSLLACLLFGAIALGGGAISWLAVRDLTGPPTEHAAVVTFKQKRAESGNPIYALKFRTLNSGLKNAGTEIEYNVTQQDWEQFKLGDRVLVRYSAYFKLLVDIQPDRSFK